VSVLGWLTSLSLRQRPPALQAAVRVAAVAGPVLLTVAALPLHSALFRGGFQFFALVLVVTLAAVGGTRSALTALLFTVLAQVFFFAPPFASPSAGPLPGVIALVGFAIAGVAVASLTGMLAHLAVEQAAFRRVAMQVAGAAEEQELFTAAAEEAGSLTGADYVRLGRRDCGNLVGVAAWDRAPGHFRLRGGWPVFRGLTGAVSRAEGWTRMDDIAGPCGSLADDARAHGVRWATVLPIMVGGSMWGVMLIGSAMRWPPSACRGRCVVSFTDLLGAVVSNAESLAELRASRTRVLAAADEARRQIERDLHDGAQQRLVSLTLAVRAAQAEVPAKARHLSDELARVADGLISVLDDLRELARGIHPTILSDGGLVPALKTLARRSIVPVELDVRVAGRLPERVEVAAYYVISEALANAIKHSDASVVQIGANVTGDVLHLRVFDDGHGGADPALGSGMMGLKDRVEALGGMVVIRSPVGAGTSLDAELPLAA
jgi:signal transduction histidine kinase